MSAGWFAGACAAGSGACLLAGRDRAGGGWWEASMLLALLALVHLLRLDLMATSALRSLAWNAGWYELRRPLQALALAAGAAAAWHIARRPSLDGWLAAGMGACLAAAWARVVSLHHVDGLMEARILGVSAGRWIEAAGLALVFAAAWRAGVLRRV